jgi:predicted nucleotidyltransferase component of viral defense system
MAKAPSNAAASVRQRLLNLARAQGQLFDVVLVAFGLERLLYRLSQSSYCDRFVLKGGLLVTLWTADTGRFTRDIDFLAFGQDDEERADSSCKCNGFIEGCHFFGHGFGGCFPV